MSPRLVIVTATARTALGPGGRPFLRAGLLALALLVVAACARPGGPGGGPEEPIPPSLEPIVLPNPRANAREGMQANVRDPRPVEGEDAGWAEKYTLASGYADGGYEEQALCVIRATLALEPPPVWRQRFEDLRVSLRVRRVETEIARADARGVRDYVSFDTDVDWIVRLRNVSGEPLRFLAPGTGPGQPSPTALYVSVVRRDLDIYGAELTRTWTTTVFLQEPGGGHLVVPAGGVFEKQVRVPAEDVGSALSGLRILDLTGSLRGLVRQGNADPVSVTFPVRAGRVVVLPGGYEPLAADPLGSLERAVGAAAPTHLLVAAEFLPVRDGERGLAVLARALAEGAPQLRTASLGSLVILRDRLAGYRIAPLAEPFVRRLDTDPGRAEALMEALARLSDERVAPDPRLWKDWWRRARQEDRRVPARRDASMGAGG